MNLELNFVENSDYRLGNYATALQGFENAIRAKDDHALAYYCASRCYERLGQPAKSRQYRERAVQIVQQSDFWREYALMFKVPITEGE